MNYENSNAPLFGAPALVPENVYPDRMVGVPYGWARENMVAVM